MSENKDDPQWDATDWAHPAWWRGHDYTTEQITKQLSKLIGKEFNSYHALREFIKNHFKICSK